MSIHVILQDETNHLFPQANRTKVMSTNQTIQTQTIIFLCFLTFFFFLIFRTDEGGGGGKRFVFHLFLTSPERKSLQYPSVSMKRFLFERNLVSGI